MSRAELLWGGLDSLEFGGPVDPEGWHVRVGVGDVGTLSEESGDDLVRRRLPGVADAPFVGDAQHKDPATLEGAPSLVEGFADEAQHVGRHRTVDLIGQGDEPCHVSTETHLPGEVKGVDRDTGPADAWPGVEG